MLPVSVSPRWVDEFFPLLKDLERIPPLRVGLWRSPLKGCLAGSCFASSTLSGIATSLVLSASTACRAFSLALTLSSGFFGTNRIFPQSRPCGIVRIDADGVALAAFYPPLVKFRLVYHVHDFS